MRKVDTCKDCPDRKRVITEDSIVDCHSYCERYKAAIERETEKHDLIRECTRAEREHVRYLADDKEKRRRKNFKCKK